VKIPVPQTGHDQGLSHPPITGETEPVCLTDANGFRVVITTVTTFARSNITNVTTTVRTTNPILPMLEGVPDVRERIAHFVGVVVGAELRRTRTMGPAIAAVNWAAHSFGTMGQNPYPNPTPNQANALLHLS
jgi:hypothetical protein